MICVYFSDLVDRVTNATGWPRPACAAALVVLGLGGFWFGWVYLSFGQFLSQKIFPLVQQIMWLAQGR